MSCRGHSIHPLLQAHCTTLQPQSSPNTNTHTQRHTDTQTHTHSERGGGGCVSWQGDRSSSFNQPAILMKTAHSFLASPEMIARLPWKRQGPLSHQHSTRWTQRSRVACLGSLLWCHWCTNFCTNTTGRVCTHSSCLTAGLVTFLPGLPNPQERTRAMESHAQWESSCQA